MVRKRKKHVTVGSLCTFKLVLPCTSWSVWKKHAINPSEPDVNLVTGDLLFVIGKDSDAETLDIFHQTGVVFTINEFSGAYQLEVIAS